MTNNKQYMETLRRGENILKKILPELNKISNEHIRKHPNKVYRREEDFKEIAVALGLYDEYIDGIIV